MILVGFVLPEHVTTASSERVPQAEVAGLGEVRGHDAKMTGRDGGLRDCRQRAERGPLSPAAPGRHRERHPATSARATKS